jgi:outer membrane protein assembly factor BamD (BamD/ComL family)
LGVSYLKAHEDEKAAVIFTSLTSLEDTDTYRNSKDLVLTGVLWYRLENYHLADNYFDEALKSPETRESLPYQAQARLWKAVVSKRFKKEIKTQYWLKELIDHHPNSPEVEWVNPIEGAHGRHSNL